MKMNVDYWDNVAPQWAQEIFNTLRHDRNRVIRTELERAARNAGSIADFGCGIGTYLPTLARLFDEVHGFDHSQACVELARKRIGRARTRRARSVKVKRAANAPKLLRGTFDAVLCVNAAIAPERSAWRRVLRSAHSLLKPNGRLILVVPSMESAALIAEAEQCARDWPNTVGVAMAESAPRSGGVVSLEGVPTKHFTRGELNGTLSELGLQVRRIQRVEYTWRSQAVKPPRELRDTLPWDWLAVARNTGEATVRKAA